MKKEHDHGKSSEPLAMLKPPQDAGTGSKAISKQQHDKVGDDEPFNTRKRPRAVPAKARQDTQRDAASLVPKTRRKLRTDANAGIREQDDDSLTTPLALSSTRTKGMRALEDSAI